LKLYDGVSPGAGGRDAQFPDYCGGTIELCRGSLQPQCHPDIRLEIFLLVSGLNPRMDALFPFGTKAHSGEDCNVLCECPYLGLAGTPLGIRPAFCCGGKRLPPNVRDGQIQHELMMPAGWPVEETY
jgi:hypothetical protein